MIDPIGIAAVRSLTVDIANLTGRLAVQSATIDMLISLAEQVDTSTWDQQPVLGENEVQVGFITTLPGQEVEKLSALLAEINALK